jgi:hypothetical protein
MHLNAISSVVLILIILWENNPLFHVFREISGKAFIKVNLNSILIQWNYENFQLSPPLYRWSEIIFQFYQCFYSHILNFV